MAEAIPSRVSSLHATGSHRTVPTSRVSAIPRTIHFLLGNHGSPRREGRRAVFDTMQRTVANAGIFVPFVYRGDYSATNPAVRGWRPNMLFEFSNSEHWDVVPR